MPLSPRDAQEELAKFAKRGSTRIGLRVDQFLLSIGLSTRLGPYLLSTWTDEVHHIGERLAELSPWRLRMTYKTFARGWERVAERAIADAQHRPYKLGYARMPFRSPSYVSNTNGVRGHVGWSIVHLTAEYSLPPKWFAEWVGYEDPDGYRRRSDLILAAAIDCEEPDVLQVLIETVEGKNKRTATSRTAIKALLSCGNPVAWQAVENLLLKAQRQEGLRQTILESVDEAHPEAFRRMLRLLLEHDLLRFSSAQRAVGVWLQIPGDLPEASRPDRYLTRLAGFLDDSVTPDRDSPLEVYLWLWAAAFRDIKVALERAMSLHVHPDPTVRRMAASIVAHITSPESLQAVLQWMRDPDSAVASTGFRGLQAFRDTYLRKFPIEDPLRELIPRLPTKPANPSIAPRSDAIASLVQVVTDRRLDTLHEMIGQMDADTRSGFAARLRKYPDGPKRRDMAFQLLLDGNQEVRQQALGVFGHNTKPTAGEVEGLETLLKRTGADSRRMAMALLLRLSDAEVDVIIRRLAESSDRQQRRAAAELAVRFRQVRGVRRTRELFEWMAERPTLDDASRKTLGLRPSDPEEASQFDETLKWTLENGLGYAPVGQITFYPRPEPTGIDLATPEVTHLLKSLDEFVHEHRDVEVPVVKSWGGEDEYESERQALGAIQWGFIQPKVGLAYEQDRGRLSIAEALEEWAAKHKVSQISAIRLRVAGLMLTESIGRFRMPDWMAGAMGVPALPKLRYAPAVRALAPWILKARLGEEAAQLAVDLLAHVVATTSSGIFQVRKDWSGYDEVSWRTSGPVEATIETVGWMQRQAVEFWPAERSKQLFGILRFVDEPYGEGGRKKVIAEEKKADRELDDGPISGVERFYKAASTIEKHPARKPVHLDLLSRLFEADAISEPDVVDQLLARRSRYELDCNLAQVGHQRFKLEVGPKTTPVADRLLERAVAIELNRGELPTPVTGLMPRLRRGVHLEQVIRILQADVTMTGARTSTAESRPHVFRGLLIQSSPQDDETPERFAEGVKAHKIKQPRLLELAFLAPQWAAGVEAAVGWEGLEEAAYWFHAHTKDDRWGVAQEVKDLWSAEIAERTPLTSDRLVDGAVDVAWYHRFRSKFDDKRWTTVDRYVKFASSGAGHARARLYGEAMDARVSREELLRRITEKRNNDAVRAFGLLPLPPGEEEREVTLRYNEYLEYKHQSRVFGSMRQASEKLAVMIGMENLARTAGYPDPLRLQWAMEAKTVEDLREGIAVTLGDLVVLLDFDPFGDPRVTATKGEKMLKEIPAAAKKVPEVKELTDRRRDLVKQAQRMRRSLEEAMMRGDRFKPEELSKLSEHPGLAPMLKNLVFVSDSGVAGFLAADAGALIGKEEETLAIPDEDLRVAHPFDLLDRGDWISWQHAIFMQERIQPFKQVFRELYVLTESERGKVESTRYGGHQVHPRQALAILGKRGWVLKPEEGVLKALHEVGLVAYLEFEETFYTPADIEGLTLRSLRFHRVGSQTVVPLEVVPPKAFSETMRDLDLIVSVANMIGFDPEASESTTEMRASVVRETSRLLKLPNVELKPRYATIRGEMADYTVHLGSGEVQQMGRGHLAIIAVRQPQRGRLFLPFVDDDPRTADIVSKVILLARDREIQDPTILSQIVGR